MDHKTTAEINEAVARKLGVNPTATFSGVDASTGDILFDVPDYCTSIAAAWEVLESRKDLVLVRFANGLGWEYNGVRADTAPMAICLAFLKLS